MKASIRDNTKKRGRPKTTGKGTLVGVRCHDEQLGPLDAWIDAQPDPKPSRPEAIRQLLDQALAEGASRLPFDASPVPYSAIPSGQFTLNDMRAAFNEMIRHIAGGRPEVERIALSFIAHLLTERGYLQADGTEVKVKVRT